MTVTRTGAGADDSTATESLVNSSWMGYPQGLPRVVVLCRRLELFSEASVAIDGSKFKAVNTRDRNFTQAKMQRRLAQIDESIARYLSQLDSADRQGEAVPEAKITRLNEKIATLREKYNA